MTTFAAESLPVIAAVREIAITFGIVGGIIVAIGYGFSQWRGGGMKASADALQAQAARISVLEDERDDCSSELQKARRDIANLEGQLTESQRQIRELRNLVMGETLPHAMQEAFSGVITKIIEEVDATATRNLKAYSAFMQSLELDYLIPIKEGIGSGGEVEAPKTAGPHLESRTRRGK